jgi:hypothetical protein
VKLSEYVRSEAPNKPWLVYEVKFYSLTADPRSCEVIGQFDTEVEAREVWEYELDYGTPAYITCLPSVDEPAPHIKESYAMYAMRTMFGLQAPPVEYQYKADSSTDHNNNEVSDGQ